MDSTAFHPPTNGAIERMHHTLTEYIKAYVEQNDHWDEHLLMCMHLYNTTDHQSTEYSLHELVFGQRARTPSSIKLPPKGQTLNEYFKELVEILMEMTTIAAMNQVQAEYQSKYYYNRKLNVSKKGSDMSTEGQGNGDADSESEEPNENNLSLQQALGNKYEGEVREVAKKEELISQGAADGKLGYITKQPGFQKGITATSMPEILAQREKL
ncbi:uncharacterized protein LOC106646172 [Copidosoma floridanum]|uniref:uncharacterized protein LOC106646172 n=1 Tax=Copidosoma floridanum TaxID=29053 RepID=UPI000C6F7F5F|nr:uncharacterized protein LOC106646172 [Copidosoma floridanum]